MKVKNSDDLERVQKSATKIIMGSKYSDYKNALNSLQLETLSDRRKRLCPNFAKKSLKHEKVRQLFPLKDLKRQLRNTEVFKVNFATTNRYQKSNVPYLQNLLNEDEKTRVDFKRSCGLK